MRFNGSGRFVTASNSYPIVGAKVPLSTVGKSIGKRGSRQTQNCKVRMFHSHVHATFSFIRFKLSDV